MELPISSWLPAAFNTTVPSRIAGSIFKIEPTVPITKNIFDMLSEKEPETKSAIAALSNMGEISQVAYPADTSIIGFFDVLEQKNNIHPAPQAWIPDNYLPKQEKENQQVNVPEQLLTKESTEQSPFNFPNLTVWQPSPESIQINNQKQNSNQENETNNQMPILNSTQQGMDITEPEITTGTKPVIVTSETHPAPPEAGQGHNLVPNMVHSAASYGMEIINSPDAININSEDTSMSRGVYPERKDEILRYAQNDSERGAQNDSKQKVQFPTPLAQQAHTTKVEVIIEPPPPLRNEPPDRLTPLKVTLFTGLTVMSKGELLEINPLNTLQEIANREKPIANISYSLLPIPSAKGQVLEQSEGKDTQPLSASPTPNKQKSNLPFTLPEDKNTASETNTDVARTNKPVIGDRPGFVRAAPFADMNNSIAGSVLKIEPTDTVLPSKTIRRDEIASAPSRNDNLMESSGPAPASAGANPRRHVVGQKPTTLPMDYKIFTDTQTAEQNGLNGLSRLNSSPQPADIKHSYVETQDVASLHKEENKTIDLLSQGKGGVTPPLPPIDEQHKSLPANLITNEQNTSINALPLDDSVKQSVKDAPKMNNPHQIPESNYNNIIEQIAQKVQVYLREGRADIKLRLEPPELGHIKLKLSVTGNKLEASIEVENLNVMRAIEKDIPRLKESISSAGIDVGKLDVLCHEGNDSHHSPYLTQHTNPETQNTTEEDTNIETVEKADERLTVTGINNALDIGRIDYIV